MKNDFERNSFYTGDCYTIRIKKIKTWYLCIFSIFKSQLEQVIIILYSIVLENLEFYETLTDIKINITRKIKMLLNSLKLVIIF